MRNGDSWHVRNGLRGATLLAAAWISLPLAGCSRGTPNTPAPASLRGTVVDSAGAAAPGIDVSAQPLAVAGGVIELRHTRTTAYGEFDFGPVERGKWLVAGGDPTQVDADTVDVPGPAAALRLATAGALRGRVLRGGSPLGNALVYIDAETQFALTGSEGHFFLGGVPAGGWWLYVVDSATPRDTAVRVRVPAAADTLDVPDIVFPASAPASAGPAGVGAAGPGTRTRSLASRRRGS